jgi:transcriptional regulator NrdR family protein
MGAKGKKPTHHLRCPRCGEALFVRDSRVAADGKSIRRRRGCENGHALTTLELIAEDATIYSTSSSSILSKAARTFITLKLHKLIRDVEDGKL